MSTSFNYDEYIAEPKCMNAMNPAFFGYNNRTKPNKFTFSFDVRTLVTGLAVNLGVLTVDQLEEILAFRQEFDSDGVLMQVQFRDELSNNASLTSAYDFCKVGNLSCSFVSFAS
eukprot:gene47293-biopygen7268